MDIILTNHAKFEIDRRQISEEAAIGVAQNPEQVIKLLQGRRIGQSRYFDSRANKEMLLRVICEERDNLLFVITAYKTSKIDKYWVEEG